MTQKVEKWMTCIAAMRWLAIGSPLLIAALSGCDLTGQYDKKFHEALDAAAKRAVFDLVRADFTDAIDPSKGVGVKLRLPTVFDGSSKPVQQPPMAIPSLPGMPAFSTYAIQRELDDDQGKWAPCVVSIVAMPKSDQKGDVFQTAMTKGLSAMMPGATWTDVSVPTPSGQTTTLKRMRIDMSQMMAQFAAAAKAKGAKLNAAQAASQMDMYLVDANGAVVFVTWGVPTSQAKKYNLEKAIEASMGTLEVTVPPDAAGKGAKGPAAGKAPPTGCM